LRRTFLRLLHSSHLCYGERECAATRASRSSCGRAVCRKRQEQHHYRRPAGFILATAALHVVGIGLGLIIGRASEALGRRILQTVGGAMAVAGIAMLAGFI